MSTIEINRNRPPVIPPADSPFFKFYERDFTHPEEPYPKGHLVGRVTVEDCVATAEAKFEQGLSLDSTESDLLRLSRKYVDYIYDDF